MGAITLGTQFRAGGGLADVVRLDLQVDRDHWRLHVRVVSSRRVSSSVCRIVQKTCKDCCVEVYEMEWYWTDLPGLMNATFGEVDTLI